MALDVGLVIGTLRYLLSEVEAAAERAGVGLPARRYVTTGGAVYDCAQVSVSANSMTTGLAGDQNSMQGQGIGPCPPGWNVAVELAVVRDATEATVGRRGTVTPPTDSIEIDTTQASADAAVLTQAIEALAGPNWDQLGNIPASIQFGEVQGGLSAVVLSVTINVWDIPEGAMAP